MADHVLIYNKGAQNVYHIPRDAYGRPTLATTPTYSIVDLRESEDDASNYFIVAAGTAASVDSVNQTIAAAAGPLQNDPRRITVTDASLYTEGRQYLLVAASGQREIVVVAARDTSNNYIYTLRDIKRDYASGAASLRGVELAAQFPASEANNEDETVEDENGPYAVIWDYTANGDRQHSFETIRVRRYSVGPWVDEDFILRGHPSLQDRLSETFIADAVQISTEEIEAELEAMNYLPGNYRGTTFHKIMIRYKALAYIFMNLNGERDEELSTQYRDAYHGMLHNIQVGRPPKDTVVVDEEDGEQLRGRERYRGKFEMP